MKATWLIFGVLFLLISSHPVLSQPILHVVSPVASSDCFLWSLEPKGSCAQNAFSFAQFFQTFALRLWCSGPCASWALRPSQLAPWNQIECAMAEIFTPATQPLSHSEWLSGWVAGPATLAGWLSGCVSHSGRVAEWMSDWRTEWLSGRVAEWLSGQDERHFLPLVMD